jgi:hypothetical protein
MNVKIKLPNIFKITKVKVTLKKNCAYVVGTGILVSHKKKDKRRPLDLVEGFWWKVSKCDKC